MATIARVRATRKGQILWNTKEGKPVGGQGQDGRRFYTISRSESKEWKCDCPASRFRKGPCKHLKALWNGGYTRSDVRVQPGAYEVLDANDRLLKRYG